MSARSQRADVRNPVLALPEALELALVVQKYPEVQEKAERLLRALSDSCRATAEKSWLKRKAPMAAYWYPFAVYFRHIRLALRVRPASNTGLESPPQSHPEGEVRHEDQARPIVSVP